MSKIIWLIRIRNEASIIVETLDHLATFCTWWVYIYDDYSTDGSTAIVKEPPEEGIIVFFHNENQGKTAAISPTTIAGYFR